MRNQAAKPTHFYENRGNTRNVLKKKKKKEKEREIAGLEFSLVYLPRLPSRREKEPLAYC